MPTESADRRRAERIVPDPTHSLSRVRLRAGRELMVIDLSAFGALVEGTTRLLPGTNVDVHVTGVQGRVLVRARVVRCAVCALTPDVIRYRGALAFAAEFELPPRDASGVGGTVAGLTDPRAGESVPLQASPWSSGLQ